jgi:ribosomal protein L32
MRKSHKWKDVSAIFVRCPYCGRWKIVQRVGKIGMCLYCGICERHFELGEQK